MLDAVRNPDLALGFWKRNVKVVTGIELLAVKYCSLNKPTKSAVPPGKSRSEVIHIHVVTRLDDGWSGV
jgi:hypothetical protein